MKSFVRFASGLILVMAANLSLGAEVPITSTITGVMPQASGIVQITLASTTTACTNANNPKRYMLSIGSAGVTAEAFKNIYAAIMLAAALEKSIIVFYDNASSNCLISRVLVSTD